MTHLSAPPRKLDGCTNINMHTQQGYWALMPLGPHLSGHGAPISINISVPFNPRMTVEFLMSVTAAWKRAYTL